MLTLAELRRVNLAINHDTRYRTDISLYGQLDHCANETGGFRAFEERLNYSDEAIRRTWPSHFKSWSEHGHSRVIRRGSPAQHR
ncbi:hypothetical protein [Sphingomonas oleivorans]|uniref:hypothetical protein n=1 Tax=Sphingomonas oleivorans TaxID=1735121 RepID=UPI0010575816|nr:hypothetical protein [Sphingomonas oleivorans]